MVRLEDLELRSGRPEDDDEPVITLRLTIDDSLEPRWEQQRPALPVQPEQRCLEAVEDHEQPEGDDEAARDPLAHREAKPPAERAGAESENEGEHDREARDEQKDWGQGPLGWTSRARHHPRRTRRNQVSGAGRRVRHRRPLLRRRRGPEPSRS